VSINFRPQHHKLIGIRIRQRCKQCSIDNTENGGIRPDAQRERQQRYKRKADVFLQEPASESNVEPKILHDRTSRLDNRPLRYSLNDSGPAIVSWDCYRRWDVLKLLTGLTDQPFADFRGVRLPMLDTTDAQSARPQQKLEPEPEPRRLVAREVLMASGN
jgi:hypothetical protein